jgi:polygalacturonase
MTVIIFNVKDYGAVADCFTKDDAAVQAAINAAVNHSE